MRGCKILMPSFVFLLALLSGSSPTCAEWVKWDEASSILEGKVTFDIHADGTFSKEVELTATAMNRNGLENCGFFAYIYNAQSTKFKILKAETINGSRTIPVDRKMIEDKPTASSLSGFDDLRRFYLVFPEVGVGSKIHYKYRIDVHKAAHPGMFFEDNSWTYASNGVSLHFKSDTPLVHFLNNPDGALNITESKRDGKYFIDVVQTKKIYKNFVNEINSSWAPENLTWIRVANVENWPAAIKQPAARFEAVASQKMPSKFAEIAASASAETDTIKKINLLVRRFSEQFRYQGDWRAVDGGYVPRPLQKIADSGYGDCKDFATSMVAILRQVGIRAHVALVNRSANADHFDMAIPSLYDFNHAIVYIDDQKLWLDPTNDFRPVEIMPSDISDRPAAILDVANPRLVDTASDRPEADIMSYQVTVSQKHDGWESYQYAVRYQGKPAFSVNYAILQEKTDIEMYVRRSLEGNGAKIQNFALREAKTPVIGGPLDYYAEYSVDKQSSGQILRTNMGEAVLLGSIAGTIEEFMAVQVDSRTSDFVIDSLYQIDATTLYLSREASGNLPTCEIKSPWLDVERNIISTNRGLQLSEKVSIKARRISLAVLKGAEFSALRQNLRDCYNSVAIVFQPKGAENPMPAH